MHSLKASLFNKEQKRKRDQSNELPPAVTLSKSQSQSIFSKPSKLHSQNPFLEASKQITIRKILKDLEKDLNQVEEENYSLIKEQAEQRQIKANPKLATQRQKQLEMTVQQQQDLLSQMRMQGIQRIESRQGTSQISKFLPNQKYGKKILKDVNSEHLKFLNGEFLANLKLKRFEDNEQDRFKPMYTYQQHRRLLNKNGVTYFEKYQPPKKEIEEGHSFTIQEAEKQTQQEYKPQQIEVNQQMTRNFSLPSLDNKKGKKNPTSQKQEQDAMIFNEVFIQPRAIKLNQLMHQHQLQSQIQQNSMYLNRGQVNASENKQLDRQEEEKTTKMFLENREKRLLEDKEKIQISALLQSKRLMEQSEQMLDREMSTHKKDLNQDLNYQDQIDEKDSDMNESDLLNQNDPLTQGESNHIDDIVKIVMRKFNSSAKLQNSQSFFTQQIQVQPPEGMANSVGGSVKDSSWAPSLPISTSFLKQQSLKDITMRAKAGVQAGDIQKEAHMAFALGNLNEESKNFKKAIKFYKRFFFCARILEDPVGASLGLNRLGVMYHKLKNYHKSLQFHQKHQQFTDSENLFASYYNLGISNRLLKNFEESIQQFQNALDWSLQHQEFESECISNGQLGVTFLIIKNYTQAKVHFDNCLKVAYTMKNKKLQLDCLLCLGYIAFISEEYKLSKNYFHKGFNVATQLNEEEIAEQCLCNMGVSMGNVQLNNLKKDFSVSRLNVGYYNEESSEPDD